MTHDIHKPIVEYRATIKSIMPHSSSLVRDWLEIDEIILPPHRLSTTFADAGLPPEIVHAIILRLDVSSLVAACNVFAGFRYFCDIHAIGMHIMSDPTVNASYRTVMLRAVMVRLVSLDALNVLLRLHVCDPNVVSRFYCRLGTGEPPWYNADAYRVGVERTSMRSMITFTVDAISVNPPSASTCTAIALRFCTWSVNMRVSLTKVHGTERTYTAVVDPLDTICSSCKWYGQDIPHFINNTNECSKLFTAVRVMCCSSASIHDAIRTSSAVSSYDYVRAQTILSTLTLQGSQK